MCDVMCCAVLCCAVLISASVCGGVWQAAAHFPDSALHLHIFEPRYRVLVSQAMNTTRCFVVVSSAQLLLHQHPNQPINPAAAGAGAGAGAGAEPAVAAGAGAAEGLRRRVLAAGREGEGAGAGAGAGAQPAAAAAAANAGAGAEEGEEGQEILACLVRIERCRTMPGL